MSIRESNRLKRREWYRPVAPTVALEHMLDLFEAAIPSPYMAFAPILRPDAARTCPACAERAPLPVRSNTWAAAIEFAHCAAHDRNFINPLYYEQYFDRPPGPPSNPH